MKICIINNRYGVMARGGAESVIQASITEYKKRGDDVFVIALKPYRSRLFFENGDIVYISSLYYFFSSLPKFLRIFWHIIDFVNVLCFLKILKIIYYSKPDLIITHNLKGVGYLSVIIPKILQINHQHVLHDIQLLHPSGLLLYGQEEIIDSLPAKIYQSINLLIFRNVTDVSSPSKWLLSLHKKYDFFKGAKAVIKRNPLSFRPAEQQSKKKKNIFTFLYVGQMEQHKGLEHLLRAFIIVKNNSEVLTAELKIIGDGSQCDRYKEAYKNEKSIEFAGRQNHNFIQTAMLEADCLVIPSVCYENSPSVFFEAIACSLPVLASDLGGNTEIKNDYDGILFTPADPADLADKMVWAIKNPDTLFAMSRDAKLKLDKEIESWK